MEYMIFYGIMAVLFLINALFCYRGYKFIHVFTVLSFAGGTFLTLMLLTSLELWIMGLIALAVAIVVFLLREIILKIGMFLYGAGLGLLLGFALGNYFELEGALSIVALVVGGILGGILGVIFRYGIVVLTTTFSGAMGMSVTIFVAMVGGKIISLVNTFLDSVPESGEISDELISKLTEDLTTALSSAAAGLIVMLVSLAIFVISGLIIQTKGYLNSKD